MKTVFSRVLALIVFLVSVWCPCYGRAGDKIRIALLAGFTGVASIPSYHLLQVAEMETKRINASGGIGGKPVELVVLDDQSNPVKTREFAQSSDITGVAGIIGFPWSQFLLAAGPELQTRKIPSISILATHDKVTAIGDYIFRVCFNNKYQGTVLANYAFKRVGVRKALIFINQQNAYSTDLTKSIGAELTRLGGEMVKEVNYIPQHGVDYFVAALAQIPTESYDSVFLPDDQVYVMPIMEAFLQSGFAGKKFFGGDGWNRGNILVRDSRFREFETYVVGHWAGVNPASEQFVRDFQNQLPAEAQDATALSYDAFHVLVEAIRKSPALSHEQIKQNLFRTDFAGMTGRIRFGAQGDPVHKPLAILKIYHGQRTSAVYE